MITLLELIKRDHITSLERRGSEHHGRCPLCGHNGNCFVVFSGGKRFYCRSCYQSGFVVKFVMLHKHLDYEGACEYLSIEPDERFARPAQPNLGPVFHAIEKPSDIWFAQAVPFAEECQAKLWSPVGAKALAYLRSRALTDEAICSAGLGYNVADRWLDRTLWGLPDEVNEKTGRPKRLWLPRGVTIPWVIDGKLAAIRIRRPLAPGDEGVRYCMVSGSMNNPLYGADLVISGKPVALFEGEFDALTAFRFASDLIVPVATGGTGAAHRVRWLSRLSTALLVLVSYDRDAGGEEGARYWLGELKNARRWAPYWDDLNGFARSGGDVRAWVEAGLALHG